MANSNAARSIVDILDALASDVSEGGMTLADLLNEFGSRSFGPLIALLGLLCLSPLGAIPGLPAVIGITLVLVCAQIVFGRSHIWLPRQLRERSFDQKDVCSAIDKTRPIVKRADRLIKTRWEQLFTPASKRAAAGLCILLAIALIPLELVPYAVALPALALTLIGLSFINHDGFLLVAGLIVTVLSAGAIIWIV